MNDHPAHRGDIVRVHPDIKVGDRNLGGMHLTVVAAHIAPQSGIRYLETDSSAHLELTEWTGGVHVFVLASDVDVIHHVGVA